MKNYYYIFIATGMSFLSCQTNDEFMEFNTTDQSESRFVTDENDTKTPNFPIDDPYFETNLEWISYFIAEALIFSADARNEFVKFIEVTPNSKGVISLGNLLDADSSNSSFLEAFENQYLDIDLETPTGLIPRKRLNIGKKLPEFLKSKQASYQQFLEYILVRNCLEIYLPNGFNVSLENERVASTALPLNQDLYNDIYIHNTGHVSRGIISNKGVNLPNKNPLITQYELDDLQNIIVAQPTRNASNCTYDGLANDFITFLSY